MVLGTSDYVILVAALIGAILGMFGGFSGALAFLAGVGAAVAMLRFGWSFLESQIETPWLLAVAALAASLIVFGLSRLVVKKIVKNLLAQPADAIFGALVAAVAGFSAALLGAYALEKILGMVVDSTLLGEILAFFG